MVFTDIQGDEFATATRRACGLNWRRRTQVWVFFYKTGGNSPFVALVTVSREGEVMNETPFPQKSVPKDRNTLII